MATIFPGCKIITRKRSGDNGPVEPTFSRVCAILTIQSANKLYLLVSGHSFEQSLIPDGAEAKLFEDTDEEGDFRKVHDSNSVHIGNLKYLTRRHRMNGEQLDFGLVEMFDKYKILATGFFKNKLVSDQYPNTCFLMLEDNTSFDQIEKDKMKVYGFIDKEVDFYHQGEITKIKGDGIVNTTIAGMKGYSGAPVAYKYKKFNDQLGSMVLLGMIGGTWEETAIGDLGKQFFVRLNNIVNQIMGVAQFRGITLWP